MKRLKCRHKDRAKKFLRQISLYLFPFFVPMPSSRLEPEENEGVTLYRFEFWSFCVDKWQAMRELISSAPYEVYSYIREDVSDYPTAWVFAYIRGKLYVFEVLGSPVSVWEGMNKNFSPAEHPRGLFSSLASKEGHLSLLGSGINHQSVKAVPFLRSFLLFLRELFRGKDFVVFSYIPFAIDLRVIASEKEEALPSVFWFLFNVCLKRFFSSYKEFKRTVEERKLQHVEDFIELVQFSPPEAVPCLECGVPACSPYLGVFCSERCFKTLFKRVERAIRRGDIRTHKRPYAYLNEAVGEYRKLLDTAMDKAEARSVVRRKFHLDVKRKGGRPPKK
ncbi:hypothetical protein HG1285_18894 [Hydrogenivirga sp. 128-5-R1-1]|nr:hypothetical protein HG1285_18894 [Hydrogenivirga sp. 128-5-R1-1]